MSPNPKFNFYATILDGFQNYLNSDIIWTKYWGWSENPPHTQEEYKYKQFNELIDRINRVPIDSEKAYRGTVFNELVDALIEKRKPNNMEVEKNSDNTCYIAVYKDRTFSFPISLCREFADYFKGALTQQRVEAILPTRYGDVLIYGFIDELMPASVHDIKTTGSYSAFKFRDKFQHLVYLYCLNKNNINIKDFEYNIVEFNSTGLPIGTYTELYHYNPDEHDSILRDHCELFIRFLQENRELITDRKIFALKQV